VAFVLCTALLVMPLVALHGSGDASAAPDRPVAAGGAGPVSHRSSGADRPAPVTIAEAPVRQVTATTLPPTTTTTTTLPPTTTTTSPPTTPTTTTTTTAPVAQAAATGAVRTTGAVTYYDHPAGRCASPWLPFGTVVWVTNPANGATVTCTVDDREADTERSIDLATATFAELAPLSQGVIDARLSW
jgi:hypothetical protein